MFAVQGVYDGDSVLPQEAIPVRESYEVVITFLRPKKVEKPDSTDENIRKRLEVAKSLFGTLPSTVKTAEVKEERPKRYESNY
ncbi:hypothetical protein AGMMS49938_18230 [Fibrobacterales bacterium]|nr:hypothetical protein AGMMS49938_18230 [Fibrobacterales bacterium]